MIVVINPSGGGGGRSFKGLHAYCAHDEGDSDSSDRVEWMSTRNVPTDNPEDGWRLMVATAQAQEELKQSAGMKAGRASKHGPVMHVVLSFAKGEPTDRAAMEAAADGFLGTLGAKTKAREQYAAEHQVVMYAHNDTGNRHLHLMINRVHPQHGANLPTGNDRLKAQKWALAYSKKHGTAERTPDREENAKARERGEYVKAKRRRSRNVHEIEQLRGEVANDNPELDVAGEAQAKDRKTLALRRKAVERMQKAREDTLADAHQKRVQTIRDRTKTEINKARHETREEFRERHRWLEGFQEAERHTYFALEKSFFGRLGNMVKLARLSEAELGHRYSSTITRTFQILTSASKRRHMFFTAQKRARSALEREEAGQLSERVKSIKASERASTAQNRATYAQERERLGQRHKADRAKLQARSREHGAQEDAALERMRTAKAAREAQSVQRSKAPSETPELNERTKQLDALRKSYNDRAGQADADTQRDGQKPGGQGQK